MYKKVSAVIMLLAVVLSACGCARDVKNREQLISYANKTYGEGTFQGSKKKLKGKESFTTIIMEDKDTGIQYTVTSSLVDVSVDGSSFGYVEQTTSDFEEKYCEYLLDKAGEDLDRIAGDYSFSYELDQGVIKIDFNDRESSKKAKEAVTEFDTALVSFDVKERRPKEYLIYADKTVYIGSYDASSDKYSAAGDFDIIDYVHANYDPEAEYINSMGAYISQFLSYDEIEKLFPGHDGTPMGKAYYFKDKNGKTFVAIDLEEFGANESGVRLFRDKASGMEEIDY